MNPNLYAENAGATLCIILSKRATTQCKHGVKSVIVGMVILNTTTVQQRISAETK